MPVITQLHFFCMVCTLTITTIHIMQSTDEIPFNLPYHHKTHFSVRQWKHVTYQWYILIWMDQLTGCTGGCEGSRLTCDWCSWFSCSAVCRASGWGCRLCVSRECWFGGLRCCRRCRIQRFEIGTNWPWHSCCSLWNTQTGQYLFLK